MDPTSDSDKPKKLRYHRKVVTVLKSKKMLGYYKYEDGNEFIKSQDCADIIAYYKDCLSIEVAPEKGERRVSDDYIYLIDEILSECVKDTPNILNNVKLFRINLLEYCHQVSEHNFDIALRLTKLYQDLNMNEEFIKQLNYLNFKGIQMESMGYLPLRQFIVSSEYTELSSW